MPFLGRFTPGKEIRYPLYEGVLKSPLIKWYLPVIHTFYYCKDQFSEFCKHFGKENTKFDKSLARPGRKQAAANKLGIY